MDLCNETGCEKPVDRDGLCFRHRVAGVGFNWVGGGMSYGRSNFSAMTNNEFVARHVGDPTKSDMQKRSTRAELI